MNALGKAAQPLIDELERYQIKVYMTEWRFEFKPAPISAIVEVQLYRHTPKWLCRRLLKRAIKYCKKYEGAYCIL